MSYYDYGFDTVIDRLPIGNGHKVLTYHVVFLLDDLVTALPFDRYPKLRIIGELADHPIRGAWNPVADGRKYFILSAPFLKAAGLAIGDAVEVRFNIDDQDYVEVPPELEARLQHDDELRTLWEGISAGKKRFYCHHLASAKRADTREKRLADIYQALVSDRN